MGCETWGREQISPIDVRISSMAKLQEGISWVTELRRAIWREGGRVLGRPRQGDGMRTEAMRGGGRLVDDNMHIQPKFLSSLTNIHAYFM